MFSNSSPWSNYSEIPPPPAVVDAANTNLPSYQCPEYQQTRGRLQFVADMYEGRSAWYAVGSIFGDIAEPLKSVRYLPMETGEDVYEYYKRLSRSYFERRFRDAIDTFAGFLASFRLQEGTADSITQNIDNVDLKGNSLEVFMRQADIKALRDGRCFILVEFPKPPRDADGNPLIKSAYDERVFNLRPYLVLIDVRNVVNWRLSSDKTQILQVTIREILQVPDGMYGVKVINQYRVLTPGGYEIFTHDDTGNLVQVEVGHTSLNEIPLIPYTLTSSDGENRFVGEPPLFDLAELNLKHYQKWSEKDEAMHKCNMAILQVNERDESYDLPTERRDYRVNIPAPPPEEYAFHYPEDRRPYIQLGPNTCLWNVDAKFVEPTGAAIGATQADIQRLEETMDKKTLSFLAGSEIQRTATEIEAFSAPVQANLKSLAANKESNIQSCFKFWCAYLRLPVGTSGIKVDEKILQAGMDAARMGILLDIRRAGEISRKTFLSLLKMGKILPNNFDIDKEIAELEDKGPPVEDPKTPNPTPINLDVGGSHD